MDDRESPRSLANLADELNGIELYQALALAEKDPHLAEVYRRFAAVEERHAQAWRQKLTDAGVSLPRFRPRLRTRLLIWLAKRFGSALVLPSVVGMEEAGSEGYRNQNASTMAGDEASHARLLREMASDKGGIDGGTVATLEGRHRAGGGNALRAAVLGANDGLLSNLSLIMGVAGAEFSPNQVLLAGLAGLLAGACSMAIGEWLSVKSSRELYQRQIQIEEAEIAANPAEEAEELALIYESRGLPSDRARELADHIMSDRGSAIATLSREELGIDPRELGGSAGVAAVTSFALFAVGAVIPLFPFWLLHGRAAIAVSAGVSTLGLFLIGGGITLFTGRSMLATGSRQVILGLLAAAITFGLGRLIGVSLAS